MCDKVQLGAIDVETKEYTLPSDAQKGRSYTCIDCEQCVILRKGEIRKHHYAHYAQSTCTYYEHPNESQIHKDAKLLMAKLLTSRHSLQFVWNCTMCNTRSDNYALNGVPSLIYREGDEVKLEYRDPEKNWIADVAIVNNGEVRYIIEIKHTHATTTPRPEPWFEVNALEFIQEANNPELLDVSSDDVFAVSCMRRDIKRYCYGSFCYKEHWVKLIPGYDIKVPGNCLLCNSSDYEPVYDGATDRFQKGNIRICHDCLMEDTVKRKIREAYAPACNGHCFKQTETGYIQPVCPDNCTLMSNICRLCKTVERIPKFVLTVRNGMCAKCSVDKYIVIYIDVPYARKDEAKSLGAMWSASVKKWYIQKDARNKTLILSKFKEINF